MIFRFTLTIPQATVLSFHRTGFIKRSDRKYDEGTILIILQTDRTGSLLVVSIVQLLIEISDRVC